jgi:hypothetical protein
MNFEVYMSMLQRVLISALIVLTSCATTLSAETGIALCIGINAVDPLEYPGFKTPLANAENDAEAMAQIARKQGFTVEIFKTNNARKRAVLDRIQDVASKLEASDVFMLSFAGHGSVVPDDNGDEPSGYDQTWCLFDAQLVDDELYNALSRFKTGVRIILFSDSCHSGSIIRVAVGKTKTDIFRATDKEWEFFQRSNKSAYDLRPYRQLPPAIARNAYFKNKSASPRNRFGVSGSQVSASAISIVACKDDELASDSGGNHGVFTDALLKIWNDGQFSGDYPSFHLAIRPKAKQKNPDQSAVRTNDGKAWPNFDKQKPFTLRAPLP